MSDDRILFPLSKDIVNLLIHVYSKKDCRMCDDPKWADNEFKCCMCKNNLMMCGSCEKFDYEHEKIGIYCDNCEEFVCKTCVKQGHSFDVLCEFELESRNHRDLESFKHNRCVHCDKLENNIYWRCIRSQICKLCNDKAYQCNECGHKIHLCTPVGGHGHEDKLEETKILHKRNTCQLVKEMNKNKCI